MVKLIVVILSVLLSFSAAFSRPVNNDSIGSTEEVLSIEEATLCISFEHYKMQDDWTPVVLSIGELNCLLWMNKDGKISEMQKSGFSLIGSVCEIDVSTKSLRKEAGVLFFDVYEQNNIRTRWRILTDRLKGTIPAKILFSKKSGIELDLGTLKLQLKHAAWDIEEFSPGLYRVQFHGPMMILSRPMVYEKTAGKLYSDHEWRNKLTHQRNQKRPQVAGRKTLAAAAIPSLERATLIALYNSTNGDNWNNNSGWKTPPLAADGFALPGTENTWYGIECDPGNTIIQRIDLRDNNLYGTLPPELGKLANLQYLNIDSNQLSGSIPQELGKLANLKELILSGNRLNGPIPPELAYLANLQRLNLGWNQLSGSIPWELGNLANLQYLNLSWNQLSGPITSELGKLDNLQYLDLYGNQLSGSIPRELGNLANLQNLYLDGNQLSGPIPPELGNLDNLQLLNISNNQLSGPIPPQLGKLANLKELRNFGNELSGIIPPELENLANLQYLDLHGNQLSGSIPPELGNLDKLQELNLESNQLSGPIPPQLDKLVNLQYLYLRSNQLSGSIPPELGKLDNLKYLDLWGNQLSGSIPPELGILANLQYLDLATNQLSGLIPPELGNLANLQYLIIWSNQLSGSIPPELGKLANLKYLNLSWNQLSGPIPPQLDKLVNLQYLYLRSNQLSGSIPPELGNLAKLIYLNLSLNRLSGPIPPELGNLANLQYLRLYGNRLSGSIPFNLTKLANLKENDGLDLRWNALYTHDDKLRDFLNSKQYEKDWESSQTIAPSDVNANPVSISAIKVDWTPIAYIWDTGGYRVFYSTNPNGPYTYAGMTADKLASSFTVTRLNSGVTYYFVVQTRTDPHGYNMNTVDSEYSAEVSAVTSPIILTSPNGGESWSLHTIRNITWTSGRLAGNIRLELWKAGKKLGTIAAGIPIINHTYAWTVGNYGQGIALPGNDYKMKIITANGLYNDISNKVFSIVQSSLTLTSPRSNDSLKLGTLKNITWRSLGLTGNVKLLLFKNGVQIGVIAWGIPVTNGTYTWTVGKNSSGMAPTGSNYMVKIRNEDNPSFWSGSGIFNIL